MRKWQGYDCTPGLALSLVTYEPFSAVFDTRQEECLRDLRCLPADHLCTAPYLLRCVFPLVQLLQEVTGYFTWVVCGSKFWYLWIKSIRKWGWAILLLWGNLLICLVCVSALAGRLSQLWRACQVSFVN